MRRLIITSKTPVSKKAFFVSTILLCLLFVLKTSPAFSFEPAPYWEGNEIKLKNMGPGEIETLEQTFEDIRGLKSGELKISPKTYEKLSRFKELFGFVFNGPEIADWVLQRIRKIEQKKTWTALVNHRKGTFQIGKVFFEELTPLERMYALVHEARHSDGTGYKHVRCPEGFPFISSRQPEKNLEKELACDQTHRGAYAYHAAFLFELFSYGLYDQPEVGLLYNSSISRIIP